MLITLCSRDGDGVLDSYDNCPLVANAGQVDADADGFGENVNKHICM